MRRALRLKHRAVHIKLSARSRRRSLDLVRKLPLRCGFRRPCPVAIVDGENSGLVEQDLADLVRLHISCRRRTKADNKKDKQL